MITVSSHVISHFVNRVTWQRTNQRTCHFFLYSCNNSIFCIYWIQDHLHRIYCLKSGRLKSFSIVLSSSDDQNIEILTNKDYVDQQVLWRVQLYWTCFVCVTVTEENNPLAYLSRSRCDVPSNRSSTQAFGREVKIFRRKLHLQGRKVTMWHLNQLGKLKDWHYRESDLSKCCWWLG